MKAISIVNSFCDYVLCEERRNKVFPNVYFKGLECDVLKITPSNISYEYEVKVSRADFFADFKKQSITYKMEDGDYVRLAEDKHTQIKDGKRTNYFYFVVPDGLVTALEVPDYAGLIYAKESSFTAFSGSGRRIFFRTVKSAPRLTKNKASNEHITDLHNKIYYRFHTLRRKSDDF